VFVSSDREDASAIVAALAERLGFAAIEVGKIAEGGRLIQARAPPVFEHLIEYPL
jgi:8-hydroxy-5-deazaflavin:NADPH oxidoreductase